MQGFTIEVLEGMIERYGNESPDAERLAAQSEYSTKSKSSIKKGSAVANKGSFQKVDYPRG